MAFKGSNSANSGNFEDVTSTNEGEEEVEEEVVKGEEKGKVTMASGTGWEGEVIIKVSAIEEVIF